MRAASAGFVHPAGVDALGAFVAPYFDMLLPIWESRTYQIAQYLIVGLYPTALADVALRERKLAFHTGDAPPVVTRWTVER